MSYLEALFDREMKKAHLKTILEARIEECEACAKVCEELMTYDEDDPGSSYAKAIRKRYKTTE